MGKARAALQRVDRYQQAHKQLAFVVAWVKKYGDDHAGSLAALLGYYGFLAVFPLLLVLTTVLGFIGNARLKSNVVGNALHQFPVIGDQLGKDAAHPLHGSGLGLAVGIIGLLYGALGVTQIAQRAMADVWSIPKEDRPGFVARLGRGAGFLAVLGVGVGGTTVISGLATVTGRGGAARVGLLLASLAVTAVVELAGFRILTPGSVPTKALWPGALFSAVGYAALMTVGTALVQHQLKHAAAVYGQFAFVLGLVGWIYLIAQVTLYGAELNAVRHNHLWPRSLLAD